MKKNFLKKLAFTMAFATAFTALSPAAGVFAAAKPSLTVGKTLTLLLGTDRAENDINVKNKVSGSKYAWSTSNKAVATVNKNGVVVGKTTGTAKVTLKITLPTKKTQTLTTTVNVKDNIKEVAINNAPEKAIKAGEEYDFNRTIVSTFGGNKKAHKGAVTRWEIVSENKDKATINDAGVFVAEEAGEYEIVAVSFQSKAKYADYLKGKDTATAKSESVKVKVENTITSLKAVKSNALEVTFASPIEKADLANYEIRDTKTSHKVYVKKATLSADKKVVTLELYNGLVNETVYELTATIDKVAMKAELKFVRGSVTRIEAVNQFVLSAERANGVPQAIVYAVYDENGLDITAETPVYFESNVWINEGAISLSHGIVAHVTIVYTDSATGKQIKSQQFTVTGSNEVAEALEGYTLQHNSDWFDFANPSTTVAMYDFNKTLRVQIVDQYGAKRTANNGTDVVFETLDPNVVIVDASTGRVSPVSIGTGYVKIVSKGTTVNRIVPITVRAASKAVDIQAPTTARGSMTGLVAGLNNPWVEVPLVDQYGDRIDGVLTFELVNAEGTGVLSQVSTVGRPYVFTAVDDNNVTYNRAGAWDRWYGFTPLKAGVAHVKVTHGDLTVKYIQITVTAADNIPTGYKLDGVKKLNVDKAYDNWASDNKETELKAYKVNRSGELINHVTDAIIEVTSPHNIANKVFTSPNSGADAGKLNLHVTDANFIGHRTGNYRVVARLADGGYIYSGNIEVVDTAAVPVVTLKKNLLNSNGLVNMTTLVNNLNVPSGFTVTDIAYTSSDNSQILTRRFGDAPISITNNVASLYNIQVKVEGYRTFIVNVTENLTITR